MTQTLSASTKDLTKGLGSTLGAKRPLAARASAPALQGAAASSSSKAVANTHPRIKVKFQVGGATDPNNTKLSYTLSQKIFHSSNVPSHVREQKQVVSQSKKPNILGTEPRAWNTSTTADHRGLEAHERKKDKDSNPHLKAKLLQVRAGLLDEKILHPCKMHTDEAIEEKRKFIVMMTGKGPVGHVGGKWFNAVDERGLCAHSIRDDWPDWNQSHCGHTKDDAKQALGRFQDREDRRKRMMAKDNKLDHEAYVNPENGVTNVNAVLRERKLDYQDLKDNFKRELKSEFPQASEERLQAMAQRLLKEKLMADEKMCRFPAHHETFTPNCAITTQDRRYKVHSHPGTWAWNDAESRNTWSCCLNFGEDSLGCEFKVVNPDQWCTLGYERRSGQASTALR